MPKIMETFRTQRCKNTCDRRVANDFKKRICQEEASDYKTASALSSTLTVHHIQAKNVKPDVCDTAENKNHGTRIVGALRAFKGQILRSIAINSPKIGDVSERPKLAREWKFRSIC